MLNEEVYKQMEQEFAKHRIEEEVEDVLLELAEMIADKKQNGKEAVCHEKIGKVMMEVCGICEVTEEDEENVYLKWIKIGKKQFIIEDYIL